MRKHSGLLGHIFILLGLILTTWWLLAFSSLPKVVMLAGSLWFIFGGFCFLAIYVLWKIKQ